MYDNEGANTANLGAKTCDLIPQEIKASSTLETFNSKVKSWCPQNCPFRLYRTYVN